MVTEEARQPSLDFAMICDRAEALNGKLYMMGGGIDAFNQVAFPSVIQFAVAIAVDVPWHATNHPHALHLSFQTEDANQIGEAGVDFTTGRPPQIAPGTTQRALFAIPNMALVVPAPAGYVMVVSLNGIEKKRVGFRVVALAA